MKTTRPRITSGDNYSLDKGEQLAENGVVRKTEIDGIRFSLDTEPDVIGERRRLFEEGFGVREKSARHPICDTPVLAFWQ